MNNLQIKKWKIIFNKINLILMYYLFLNFKTVIVVKALQKIVKEIYARFQISVIALQNIRLTRKIQNMMI